MVDGMQVTIAARCIFATQVLWRRVSKHTYRPFIDQRGQELPGWGNDDGADMMFFDGFLEAQQLLHNWNQKRKCLSTTSNSLDNDIFVGHKEGNGRCLNRGHSSEPH